MCSFDFFLYVCVWCWKLILGVYTCQANILPPIYTGALTFKMKGELFLIRLILIFIKKYVININRKEQESLSQKSLLKCVFISFPQSFEWAFATCGGCHSYPQGTPAALSPSNRKWPASSWREGLVWSWSWSLIYYRNEKKRLRDKGAVSVSPYKPHIYPKLLSFRSTLERRLN